MNVTVAPGGSLPRVTFGSLGPSTLRRDTAYYPTGVKGPNAERAAVSSPATSSHPEWNYTIGPGPKDPTPVIPSQLFRVCGIAKA